MRKSVIVLLVAASLPCAAVAAPVDNYASAEIMAARYDIAEHALTARLLRAPSDPPALLNLALVYRYTSRQREANGLYNRVLARHDLQLRSTKGQPVWAHDVARSGLRGTVEIASN